MQNVSAERYQTTMVAIAAGFTGFFFRSRLIETYNLKQSMSTLEVHIMNCVPKIIV